MNEKLTLIAAIVVEAFSKVETENIATATIRALMNNCEITIQRNGIKFESQDFGDECEILVKISNHEENICIQTRIYSDEDTLDSSMRTVVFAEASHAIQFACSQIANQTLDPEFSIVPLLDSRETNVSLDDEDEDDDSDDFDTNESVQAELEREENRVSVARIIFVENWYGSAPFERLLYELGIQAASKEYAITALKEYESGDNFDEVVNLFEIYWEGDVSQYDWDHAYDLLDCVIERMAKQMGSETQRKTLVTRIAEWVKK